MTQLIRVSDSTYETVRRLAFEDRESQGDVVANAVRLYLESRTANLVPVSIAVNFDGDDGADMPLDAILHTPVIDVRGTLLNNIFQADPTIWYGSEPQE